MLLAKLRTRLGEAVVVLQRDLDRVPSICALDVDRARVDRLTVLVQVAHERDDAALEVERVSSLVVPARPRSVIVSPLVR